MSRGCSGDLMCMEPFPEEQHVLHELPCPECGAKGMVDDQMGGLHCRHCGHIQQMGWDDPESWIEGKFNWDFNLPLEGMAEGDELLEPGERNWVVPTRDFGPRHHGSTRSLYHGTLLDHLPSIQQHGLLPEVGPFVSDAYDLNEPSNWMAFSPEEVGVEPVAFMTDKKRLEKALNAIRFNVGQKLDKRWSDVTPLDVRNHGLLLKHKGEMGAQDPPMNYVWDERHEEPFEEGPRAHQPRGVAGEGPFQAEPGDYYSREPVEGLEPIHGPAMMRVFERQGLIPWWDPRVPEQGVMPDAAKEVYGMSTVVDNWHFAMPVTPQYWQQRPADFALYHGTSPKHLESIMQHGLHPWDSEIGPGTNYAETPRGGPSWLTPRPGHVYLSQDPRAAHDRGLNAEIGHLPPGTNVEEQVYNPKTIVFKVDPRKLDPQHVNPDEDFMIGGGEINNNNQEDYPEYESLGEMADRFGWGNVPSDTERVLNQGKSIGYRGVIPPEALTPGKYGPGGWTPLERTASWQFQSGLNPRKFFTTAQDHERGKRRWGFPKPRALGKLFRFKRAAVDPAWLQKWIEVNGPYMTHQTDSEATRQKIEQEGLIPHDQGPGSQYAGTLVPRANHSYVGRNLKSLSAYSKLGEGTIKNRTLAVDLRKLDPARINADEDSFDRNAFNWLTMAEEAEALGDMPWPRETREDEPGFPGVHGVVDAHGNRFTNGGEWANKNNIVEPKHTAWSMNAMGHAAIEGGVPPEALVHPDVANQDLEQNWPQVEIPERYGQSHQVVPFEQPAEAQRAASLIGEMRDGWGRFASAVPWAFGTPGKGIYFPDTGTLRVWADDRTHPEVVLEDENASQGDGHHFVIRPDGTVKDQGAMNSDFESVEGDVGGLAQALHELDPRLHIAPASTNSWQFGPTEPMEEEPSSVSRGEEGGQIHDVQTANDFAGGL